MTGPAHWLAIIPLVVVAVAVGLVWWRDRRAKAQFRHETRTFRCPLLGQRVTADLVRENSGGSVTGVATCSAFTGKDAVPCPKECVAMFKPSGKTVAV
jgi:hypothetical protein